MLWSFPRDGPFGWLTGRRSIEGRPGVPAPRPESAAAIADVARLPFTPDAWWGAAAAAARAISARTVRTQAIREACACMVRPPPPEDAHAPWDWWFRVQVASAFVVARSEDAWPGPRGEALLAITRGPVDWCVTAALAALTEIAIRDASLREAIVRELAAVLTLRPMCPVVAMCIADPLVDLMLRMPDNPVELRARFVAMRAARLLSRD